MSVQQRARLRHQEDIPGRVFDAGVLQWLVDRSLGAEHLMAYRLIVGPNSMLRHAHPGAEEVLYVLEGRGEIRVENASHAATSGQAVLVPDGAEHAYINSGDRPFVVVGAMAPAVDPASIPPAGLQPAPAGLPSSHVRTRAVGLTVTDEQRVTPTMMGERTFRVLISPAAGCRQMTQFTGIIPTGRAPLHAHPHEEVAYVLAGRGALWIEEDPVGDLRPGSVVFLPIGVRHTIENTGREAMKVLGAFSPAGSPAAKLDE